MKQKLPQETPVYMFLGFLESGKTKFIQETLEDPRFSNGEKTLLLVMEEGGNLRILSVVMPVKRVIKSKSRWVMKIAVNKLEMIPIPSVTANPLTGPVPKFIRIIATNKVVMLASKTAENAFA